MTSECLASERSSRATKSLKRRQCSQFLTPPLSLSLSVSLSPTSPTLHMISSYDGFPLSVQTSLSERRYRSITDILASQMADGSYKTFNVVSVKRHQAIHNNAVHTPATPVTFIQQIIQLSEIQDIFLPTIKCTNHHGRVYSAFREE